MGDSVLFGHGRIAHQSVVGIERHAELVLVVQPEGVFFDPLDRPGVDVAGETDLEGEAFVEHVLGEIPHPDDLLPVAFVQTDVLDQVCCMADPVRPAPLDRLPDALLAKGLTGMHRDIEVFPLNVVEGIDVFFRRIPPLFACKIESYDSPFTEINGQFGHLQREFHVPHGTDDNAIADAKVLLPFFQPFQDCVHDFVPMQSFVGVEDGGKTGFHIDYTVFVHVFDHFIRDAFEGFLGLHHGRGVRKPFKVQWQAAPAGTSVKPVRKSGGILRRKSGISLLPGQLDDCPCAESAVKMIMKDDFRQGTDEPLGDAHREPEKFVV